MDHSFAERLAAVQISLEDAARRSGRTSKEITLLAVSKTHPPEAVAEACRAGQKLFGESRPQEARAKTSQAPSEARWHFIGHLQKNKVRAALPLFELIHSVDSLALAQDVNRIAEELSLRPRLLLEVNVAGESSKHGFAPEALRRAMEELLALPRLEIEGLMTIPPVAPEPEDARPFFAQLRELRDRLEHEFQVRLATLSMGMSDDFPVAIAEGATIVRVGSALFGPRPRVE